MNNIKKACVNSTIFAIFASSFMITPTYAQTPEGGLAFSVIKRKENYKNIHVFPFLHQWNDVHTTQLLSKLEAYANKNETLAPLRDDDDRNYKAWNVRQILYYGSSCLEKAIYEQPGKPSSPFTEDYDLRLKKIYNHMNLKDETFEIPNERDFNNFCSNILKADFDSGYCNIPSNKTQSVDIRPNFSIYNAFNITTNTKDLPKRIPLSCTLTKNSPEFVGTYDAEVNYFILKPFEQQSVNTSQGPKTMNVGQMKISFKDSLNMNKELISWELPIYQHPVPPRK